MNKRTKYLSWYPYYLELGKPLHFYHIVWENKILVTKKINSYLNSKWVDRSKKQIEKLIKEQN